MAQNLGKPLENLGNGHCVFSALSYGLQMRHLCNENVSAGITDCWMCRLDVNAPDARPASEFGLVSRSR